MKLLSILLFLISVNVFSKQKFIPSTFEVIPLNSPVKESTAKFSLKLPTGFMIDKLKVKLVNAFDLKKDQKKFEEVTILNNQFSVSVSKLPPGFYRLYVTVIDHGTKRGHEFKTNYHDFVRFVIDETMEVPMPDEKENNKTLEGIDRDKNGIRDDIQRYINETFANKPNTKLAAKQLARAAQEKLIYSIDPSTATTYMGKRSESYSCFSWITENAHKKETTLRTKLLNTEIRIKKSLQIDQWLHGYGLPQSMLDFQESYAVIGGERDYSVFCDFSNPQKEE